MNRPTRSVPTPAPPHRPVIPLQRVLRGVVAGTVVAAAAVVGPLGATSASAAPSSFVVDDGTDAVDASLDGVCATGDGTCTLRAAIQEANHLSGTTEVSFAPSADTVNLSLSGDGGADVGDLDLGPGVTVHLIGNQLSESETTTVKLGSLGDRAFHVTSGARLELDLVHLSGGSTTGDGGAILNEGQVLITNRPESTGSYLAVSSSTAAQAGGAIANKSGASVEIRNVSTSPSPSRVDLFGSTAGTTGGAIANSGGTVLLDGNTSGSAHDVYVDASSATGDGGSIHNSTGSVTLGCRAFARFSSAARGGGVFNAAGSLTFAGGGVDGGSSGGDGGGVYNDVDGTITLEPGSCGLQGQITRSVATGDGGGLFNLGVVDVPDGTILSVSGAGTGRDAASGGGMAQAGGSTDIAGQLQLTSLTAELHGGGAAIAGGTFATSGTGSIAVEKGTAGGGGGGVAVLGGSFDASAILQSNGAGTDGGGVAVTGSGSATLRSSAVFDNTATRGGGVAVTDSGALHVLNTTVGRNSGPGGGIEVDEASLSLRYVTVADNWPFGLRSNAGVSMAAVLMARNNSTDCIGVSSGGDRNVFDDWTCSPTGEDLTDGGEFDAVSNGIELDANQQQPFSYELEAGSPAIDFVAGKGCGDPSVDQQGGPRPLDGDGDGIASCDAGAIEAAAVDAVVTHQISGTVYDEATLRPIERACVYMVNIDGDDRDGDGELVRAGDGGSYVGSVADGRYLVAFFVPNASGETAEGERDCGEAGIDRDYQPEWYRNVPVEFEDEAGAAADDPGGDSGDDGGDGEPVVMPDLSEVTLVTVAGADVTGIDACLGSGPGAGLDIPCTEAAEGMGAPATPGATPTSAAAGAASTPTPASLAFTGANGLLVLLSTALLLAGTAFLLAARRREGELGR